MLSDLHYGQTALRGSQRNCLLLCGESNEQLYITDICCKCFVACKGKESVLCFSFFSFLFLSVALLSDTLCHACCFVFLAAEAAINQKTQSILDIKMDCGLTMRLSLFCHAFMSLRLGLYVKYTFVYRFLLFLTSELTKEDSCCAL